MFPLLEEKACYMQGVPVLCECQDSKLKQRSNTSANWIREQQQQSGLLDRYMATLWTNIEFGKRVIETQAAYTKLLNVQLDKHV